MVMALERILVAAELAARAAKTIKALRNADQPEAARVLETECNAACKRIVSVARGRRRRATRARSQQRSGDGRFG